MTEALASLSFEPPRTLPDFTELTRYNRVQEAIADAMRGYKEDGGQLSQTTSVAPNGHQRFTPRNGNINPAATKSFSMTYGFSGVIK